MFRSTNTRFFPTALAVMLCCIFVQVAGQKIPPRPNPPRLVNDSVNLLTPDQRAHLEEKLVAYDDSTSIQIAVVILPELQDRDPVDFAVKLGREWGVGNKKTNNGVVILMSMQKDNRKVFIAPGYGLEGALPDIVCKQIVEAEMIPHFKQDNYYRGLERAADAIIKATRGEYKAPKGYRDSKGGGGSVFLFVIILIVVLVLLGGRGGGGGGDAMTRRGHRHMNTPPFIFFPPIGGGGGRSGGFGGGGGFGGFGGGSFGGGGAGGSW